MFATRHTDEWRHNVDKLLSYASVFNARKVVIVRSDKSTVDPAEVEKRFAALSGVEFVHRDNDPKLWETASFVEDFGKLITKPDEVTFYAHTKGVRYVQGSASLPTIRRWRNFLYDTCLSKVPEVETCSGVVKRFRPNGWHFSGNYWWVNHASLLSKSWQNIEQNRDGVESYLPKLYAETEVVDLNRGGPQHRFL